MVDALAAIAAILAHVLIWMLSNMGVITLFEQGFFAALVIGSQFYIHFGDWQ